MRRKNVINAVITAAIATAVCVLDQLTKNLVTASMELEESREFIPGVLNWTYIRNRGMALGLLADHRWVFMVLSVVMITLIVLYVIMAKNAGRTAVIALAMILGGGVGNMIDRFAYGYVVDFIDVRILPGLWKWIFNVADAFVTVGAVILAVYYIVREIKKSKAKGQKEAENSNDV